MAGCLSNIVVLSAHLQLAQHQADVILASLNERPQCGFIEGQPLLTAHHSHAGSHLVYSRLAEVQLQTLLRHQAQRAAASARDCSTLIVALQLNDS